MTVTQAPPAQAAVPALPAAAAAIPHRAAAGHAVGRRTAHFRPARAAALLAGGAAAALFAMAAAPAMASTTGGRDTASAVSISPILGNGDIVTGARGTTDGNVILTGAAGTGNGVQSGPFLYRGPLTRAADGAPVSVLAPQFPGVTTATFYGPDTHLFNPDTIPAGQVRAVGSYQSSASQTGVINRGMIYLGRVSGPGGSWASIDVPADGSDTVGGVRACPPAPPGCFVMDTIAHSTMGDLVVGNYDLNPGHGISANAFIYNMSTRLWTLLRLGGSLASGTTLYGIWQDGGPGSPHYTLAGGSLAHGSSPHGNMRAFLMNYNERTGAFGKPRFYNYGNTPALFTHFDGITAVPGGFNLAAVSSAQASSMTFVPVTGGDRPSFGRAAWYPIPAGTSRLCSPRCTVVTANTVYGNQVMGLYLRTGSKKPRTYLATIPTSVTTAGHHTPVR